METNKQELESTAKRTLMDEANKCAEFSKKYLSEKNPIEFQYWTGKLAGIITSFMYFGHTEEVKQCQAMAQTLMDIPPPPMIDTILE